MIRNGTAYLYDCVRTVTNWSNSIRFHVTGRTRGDHNIARFQYHAWFNGPDGYRWHGVRYGDNTQVMRCKRTRERWRSAA